MQLMGNKHYPFRMFSDGMGWRNLATAEKIAISEVSCEDHVGDFLRLARRNPQRICSEG